MVLLIDRVSMKHFRKYTFQAVNDVGSERWEIEIVRGTADTIIYQFSFNVITLQTLCNDIYFTESVKYMHSTSILPIDTTTNSD